MKIKKFNIGSKITSVVLILVAICVLAISYLAIDFTKNILENQKLNTLRSVNNLKASKVSDFFKQKSNSLKLIDNSFLSDQSRTYLNDYLESNADSLLSLLNTRVNNDLSGIGKDLEFKNILITSLKGKIVYAPSDIRGNHKPGAYINDPDGQTVAQMKEELTFSNLFQVENDYVLYAGKALKGNNGNNIGLLIGEVALDPVFDLVDDTVGLGKTGETILSRSNNNKAVYLNPLRHDSTNSIRRGVYLGENSSHVLQSAAKGSKGSSFSTDYRGKRVLATWQPIPALNWGILTKIDTNEIYGVANTLSRNFWIAGVCVILLSLMISFIFSRFLTSPLLSLKSYMNLLGKGILPTRVQKQSNDEIGDMAETVDHLTQGLKRTANFAHQIGKGEFDSEFQPLSEEDTLGNALITMRDSIQESEQRDRERNWIVTGVAEIGEILRAHNSIQELGDAVISYMTNKIEAVQGAFYVVNDEEENNHYIELVSSYAYNKKKYLDANFKFGEGLVGQAAIEQDTIFRTEIPYDYVTITSGILGDQRPESILIVPLITNEQVYGVVELASFGTIPETYRKFVEEISVITARTVFNIKVNERTRKLLEESQELSNELQEQQEVLRQNAEEMEATQEELKRANQQLEEQIEEVNRTQKRMALLLENASEVITIYEKDESIRYISPSVERILGYSQDEMIGKSDIHNIHEEWVSTYEDMFKSLLENPDESVSIQFVYTRKDGHEIWLEATGTNLLDDPAIQGIVVNSRDITEQRRAEQEERMRTKMQALSENSPDLITRLDDEGVIFYINPVIEDYTGYKPEYFLRQNLNELDFNQDIKDHWNNIVQEVKNQHDKIDREVEFSSSLGNRNMQVDAIPEFDEENKLESVLIVSHDITERKQIEIEIQNKNKKITESINYAKRIQSAILPDNEVIHQAFPDSFIYYKARDVVSGDFPWFLERGDDKYIAAVDCTGHGVPGALISLIGYFLLNDIVRSQQISDPGKILDNLDERVTQTLRQDSADAATKDGMDIALCHINKKKGELQFAGAHRPLYVIKNGEIQEYKGDKFPIGGGKYKNQTNFNCSSIKIESGDRYFFCSDGFPDQFGGPDGRKFGPKRLRELIQNNADKSMDEVEKNFDEAWQDWKGNERQIDDVLMIGLKF